MSVDTPGDHDPSSSNPSDPIEALRAANPVPVDSAAGSTSTHDPRSAPDALFQEIIMTDPSIDRPFGPAPTRESLTTRHRGVGRRVAIAGVAAATAAAIGVGAMALVPGNTTAAEAAMIGAAQQTEASDSGTAIVTIVADHSGEAMSFALTSRFDGDDLEVSLDADGSDALGIPIKPELRIVDGVIYVNVGAERWLSVDDPNIAALLSTFGMPVDIRNDLSSGIVDLVKEADDAEALGDDRFRATVTVGEARTLAGTYPSLGLYTDRAIPGAIDDEELVIDVTVDDAGLIDVITIGADATDPGTNERITGSITIDFEDMGVAQAIEAPADAEALDLGTFMSGDGRFGD